MTGAGGDGTVIGAGGDGTVTGAGGNRTGAGGAGTGGRVHNQSYRSKFELT